MVGLAYGNPIYARVVAINGRNHTVRGTRASHWVAQWPTAPVPTAGDPVRIGTYNVEDGPRGVRAAAIARNIGSHGVTIAGLQEAQEFEGTAQDVVATLNRFYGGHWGYVDTNYDGHHPNLGAKEVVYRTDRLHLVANDIFRLVDLSGLPYTMSDMFWASFQPIRRDGGLGRLFYVVSAHFGGTPSASWSQDAWTGTLARLLVAKMQTVAGSAPVLVVGDLRDTRRPWGERAGYVPAQPTFVRAGYYDAYASRSRVNGAYATVNGHDGIPSRAQRPNVFGVGPRADYILMKGIRGSVRYVDVANWSYKGLVPSDHNLVYSDINIPKP